MIEVLSALSDEGTQKSLAEMLDRLSEGPIIGALTGVIAKVTKEQFDAFLNVGFNSHDARELTLAIVGKKS